MRASSSASEPQLLHVGGGHVSRLAGRRAKLLKHEVDRAVQLRTAARRLVSRAAKGLLTVGVAARETGVGGPAGERALATRACFRRQAGARDTPGDELMRISTLHYSP